MGVGVGVGIRQQVNLITALFGNFFLSLPTHLSLP